MRALALLAAATLALGGCTKVRPCKDGTVLVSVDFPEGADKLEVVLIDNGMASAPQPVTLSHGATRGTVELDFGAYPAGHMVSVSVTARAGDRVLGVGTSSTRPLASGCDHLALTVSALADGGVDEDGGGGGSCATSNDCPMGMACDAKSGSCTTTCSSTQPCHGGCCNGTTCAVGDTAAACALGDVLCGSCAGKSSGGACLNFGGTNVCGCKGPGDCPANQACTPNSHTCGSACDGNTPCNGGCCSAASGGTCQTGTAKTVCGSNGSLCADCSANQNGHVCTVVAGGGQCGCSGAADCPSSSAGCSNGLCINTCSTATPCLSGCCTADTGGSCQPGTAQTACGAPGSRCNSCIGNVSGSACLSSGACGCNSANDCPVGAACDASLHKCTKSCNVNQPCRGGCCSASGTCVAGSSTTACGSAGSTCAICATNTACATYTCNGSVCITTYASSSTQCLPADPDNCTGAAYCTGSSPTCPIPRGCLGGGCCFQQRCVSPCP